MTADINAKELAPVKARVTKAEAYATALVISNDDDQKKATIALSELNKMGDDITSRKEAITKPLNAAIKSVRDLFKPLETGHEGAVKMIKQKLIAYHEQKVAKEAKDAAALAARVAKGTMKPETAANKLAALPAVEKNIKTEAGALQYKKVPTVYFIKTVAELTDAQIIEHARAGLLVWNETAAKKAALATDKEGEVLAGIEVKIETRAANIR